MAVRWKGDSRSVTMSVIETEGWEEQMRAVGTRISDEWRMAGREGCGVALTTAKEESRYTSTRDGERY
jgi:hypothetical protein